MHSASSQIPENEPFPPAGCDEVPREAAGGRGLLLRPARLGPLGQSAHRRVAGVVQADAAARKWRGGKARSFPQEDSRAQQSRSRGSC